MGKEKEGERDINFFFYLFMLAEESGPLDWLTPVCTDWRSNLKSWHIVMTDALINLATQPLSLDHLSLCTKLFPLPRTTPPPTSPVHTHTHNFLAIFTFYF